MISLTSDNKKLNRFLDYLTSTLKETNTKLVLSLSDVYIDGSRVAGYYSHDLKSIVIRFEDNYLETLIHEFCHYIQFTKNKRVVRNIDESLILMWQWLNHEIELPKKDVERVIKNVQALELDCERMSVAIIKKYKLDIDLEKYIKSANLYIYFHNYVLRNRMWLKDDMGIDSFTKLLKLMPNDLKGDRTNMNENWYKILDSYF